MPEFDALNERFCCETTNRQQKNLKNLKKKNRKKKSFESRYNFAARGGATKIDTPYESPLWAILKTENHLVLRPVV
jgi:hypothetical protein